MERRVSLYEPLAEAARFFRANAEEAGILVEEVARPGLIFRSHPAFAELDEACLAWIGKRAPASLVAIVGPGRGPLLEAAIKRGLRRFLERPLSGESLRGAFSSLFEEGGRNGRA
jgi:hypothetical protein